MREIRSKDNKIWKRCEQLTMRKYRDRSGLYLIEGENLLDEAIRNHVRIETVLVREDCQKALPPEAADKAFLLDARLFDKLAQTVTSQGILAVVAKAEVRKEDFIGLPGSNFIVLDRLQDPGNIGTILRTADAAGYRLAILMKGTADVYAAKGVRAATRRAALRFRRGPDARHRACHRQRRKRRRARTHRKLRTQDQNTHAGQYRIAERRSGGRRADV